MAFSQELADRICAELAEGKSLRAVCAQDGMPNASTVLRWTEQDEHFAQQYTGARARGYQLLADEILEIADDGTNDAIETEDGPRTNQDVISRSRLRVDTRKWMLSKMLPKIYGDKLDLAHSGSVKIVKELTEDELQRIASGGGT